MQLSQLLEALPWQTPPGADPDILAIAQDSRQVQPGTLFVARAGGSTDGHTYIPAAIRAGAAAIVGALPPQQVAGLTPTIPYIQMPDPSAAIAWLAAALHHFPARKLCMIGVTGTDGKTTTSNLIHSILTAVGHAAGLISTVNAIIGDTVHDTGLHVTTPDPQDVQHYLAQMVAAGLTHCVLEATSHGLAQGRVDACDFDIAVVTNITHEHIDFHGSLAGYRQAKARLFESLATAHPKPGINKLAVLNRDDGSWDYLPSHITTASISYGLHPDAQIRAVDVQERLDGLRYTAQTPSGQFDIQTPLLGHFNVSNTLAAVAVGHALQLPIEAIQTGIANLKGIPGRMEHITVGVETPYSVIVDFAHTPNSLRQALIAARKLAEGRVIVVFGSAGLRDVDKRTLMGEVAGELADEVIVTAEDPRTESLRGLLAASAAGAASRGAVAGQNLWQEPDRSAAIRRAVDSAQAGDVVIICGKAHEQSMCFGTIEYPWDDRLATRAALAARLGLPPVTAPQLPTANPNWVNADWA